MAESEGHFTLLLVDDNPTNLSLLAQIVEMDLPQVRVYTAQDAATGFELAAAHEMDGAFFDVQMPGMSGLDMCRKFKEDPRFSRIPVVLMTAHIATAELRAEGLDAGAYDFISQPISNVEMLARIKVMLRLRQSEKRLFTTNEQLRGQIAEKTSALRWLSGLLMAGGDDITEEDRELANKLEARMPQDRQFNIEQFSGQLFQEMPLRWRRTVLKLTLLDEVPLPLGRRLAEIADVEGALDYLWRHNFFVDQAGVDPVLYRFQQDLRNRLRRQAKGDLSQRERQDVYLLAADWYRQQGQAMTALGYLLTAELYSEAELLLSQQGGSLLPGDQLPKLAGLMERIPAEVAVKRGWLTLFVGIAKFHRQPKKADAWLELARTYFSSKNEGRGELLALIQQVEQYLVVDGRFDLGRDSLPRLKELLECYTDDLDLFSRSKGYAALAVGEIFFGGNLEQAEDYTRTGLQFAIRTDSAELQFNLRLVSAYLALLKCRCSQMFSELEAGYVLLRQLPQAGQSRFFQNTLACALLLRSGDFFNFRAQHLQLEQRLGKGDLQQNILGPVLCQSRVECLLAEDRLEEARDLLEVCLAGEPVVFNAHLRSLLLQYRAFLWVGEKERDGSVQEDLQESIRLRQETGGLLHILNNRIVSAACRTEQGNYSLSEQLLQQALELSEEQGVVLPRSGIYARQADLLLRRQREEDALLPLEQLLQLLEKQHQGSFFLLTPDLLRRLLPVAVRQGILPEVARRMAIRHLRSAIRDDGSFLPLLEVVTLGASGFYLQGRHVLACSELGSISRQMLDLLIMAPSHRLGLEHLLGLLWPESSQDKARGSFDTNLSRLRKILDGALGAGGSKDYLVLEKGVLSLQNVLVDCHQFADAVKKGQQHARRQATWQAGLAFRFADHLWRGEFLEGLDLSDDLVLERRKLTEMRLDMVESWSELLMLDDAGEEVESLLQQGLRLDPTREPLVRRLYRFHLRRSDQVRGRKILETYRYALMSDDYSEADATNIMLTIERDEKTIQSRKENNESM